MGARGREKKKRKKEGSESWVDGVTVVRKNVFKTKMEMKVMKISGRKSCKHLKQHLEILHSKRHAGCTSIIDRKRENTQIVLLKDFHSLLMAETMQTEGFHLSQYTLS